MQQYLSVGEASQILGVTPQTIYGMVASGALPAIRIGKPGSKRPALRIAHTAIASLGEQK